MYVRNFMLQFEKKKLLNFKRLLVMHSLDVTASRVLTTPSTLAVAFLGPNMRETNGNKQKQYNCHKYKEWQNLREPNEFLQIGPNL